MPDDTERDNAEEEERLYAEYIDYNNRQQNVSNAPAIPMAANAEPAGFQSNRTNLLQQLNYQNQRQGPSPRDPNHDDILQSLNYRNQRGGASGSPHE